MKNLVQFIQTMIFFFKKRVKEDIFHFSVKGDYLLKLMLMVMFSGLGIMVLLMFAPFGRQMMEDL
jgi:hypothetical protein